MNYASHAETVFVPKNLTVKIPEGVSFDEAAFVTLGAIALQGLRVGAPSLGEVVAEAAGFHVGGPPREFVGGSRGAVAPGPGEGFGVGLAAADEVGERRVVHAEELAGPEVHAGAEVGVVFVRKPAGGVEADQVVNLLLQRGITRSRR